MSNAVVIDIPIAVMDRLGTATFEELAEFAEESIERAGEHARQSIHHLIAVGGALTEMRERMPGQYPAWLQKTGMGQQWASRCERLYLYRNELPQEALTEWISSDGRLRQPTLTNAIKSIAHLPKIVGTTGGHNKIAEEHRATARRMLSEGVPCREVASMTGISLSVVKRIKNPGRFEDTERRFREKKKIEEAAARALREQKQRAERDRLAKTTGKEASVAYAAVRQALAALDRVSGSASHVRTASDYLVAAEARIVAIMQAERASQ